jgi:1-acyl-sn-glycerol-3-phosphate acyltransferase
LLLLLPVVVLSGLAGYSVLRLSLVVPVRDRVVRARRLQRFTAGAFRLLFEALRWTRIADIEHRCAQGAGAGGPYVVVANHPTLIDVAAITAALGGGCAVAKPAVFRRSGLHALMAALGNIEGTGGDRLATRRVVDEAVDRLRTGLSVIVFPEGTRSPPGGRRPFGRMAFEIACRAGVPIVSVRLRCDPPWLTKEVGLLRSPHPAPRLRLEVLATDDPASLDYDSRALQRRVESRFG